MRWTWQVKIAWQLEAELFTALRERAEEEAIRVFGQNLNDLLLAAPAGARVTMGLDPGIRTGVKVAIVDRTGKVVDTSTVYPFPPKNDLEGTLHALGKLAKKHCRRTDRHRQRHRFARNRSPRRRTDQAPSGIETDESRGVGGRCVGVFRVGACLA